MQAQDVMARDVLTVTPATKIDVALALMLQRKVSGLPVLDSKGKLAGILTEGDLLHRAETGTAEKHRSKFMEFLVGPGREAAEFVKANSRVVGDLMTTDVISVTPSTPVEEVVSLMERHRIRRLTVLDKGILVGIISRADLLKALARKLADAPAIQNTDAEIEASLRKQLASSDWTTSSNVGFTVQNGVVTYNGFVYDERTRQALVVAAQNTPGVTSVVDQLVWLDITTGMVVP